MAQHVTVQQPTSWIVEYADYVAAFTRIDQCRVSQVAQDTFLIDFIEVMAMQMDAVRKRCPIRKCNPSRLPILK